MCAVYRCGRCGKHRLKSEHCAAPRRFEGTCDVCGQYGHKWRNSALSSRGQPHLNVFTSSGECPVTESHGADIIVIPQQQQHHQPAVDLGCEDIPFQQSSDSMYYSNGVSGGGGRDGDAIGTGVQQQMAVAGHQSFVTVAHGSGGEGSDDDGCNSGVARQPQLDLRHNGGVVETSGTPGGDPGGDGGDGSGPLSGTCFGGDDGGVYRGCFALQLVCFITPNPSSQMLSVISTFFATRRPGSTIFLGDTGAVIHGVSFGDCVYNRRQPRPWKRYLMLGDGKCMPVGFYGDLDLDLHCEQDMRVTLKNVVVVSCLAFDIMPFDRMQERHEIILNRAGASMLGGRVRFKTFCAGSFIQATCVPHGDTRPQPPAMVAAMMRPGPPSSMNVNDLDISLGHTNDAITRETAKQMGMKVADIRGYCDGCGEAKAIRRAVPRKTRSSRGGHCSGSSSILRDRTRRPVRLS